MAANSTASITSAAPVLAWDATTGRREIAIYNDGPGTVYVGGSSVTSSNGLPVGAGGYLTQNPGEGEDIYAITSSGQSATVRVLAIQPESGMTLASVAVGSPGVVGGSGVSSMLRVTATGDIVGFTAYLRGVSLTAGSDAATATVRAGGSGGTVILTLKAAASSTIFAPISNVQCSSGIHVTLTGTGPESSVVYSI